MGSYFKSLNPDLHIFETPDPDPHRMDADSQALLLPFPSSQVHRAQA